MAAYMRSMMCFLSFERNAARGSNFILQSKRYVRGLRRKPVKVLFPGRDKGKIVQPEKKSNREPNRIVKDTSYETAFIASRSTGNRLSSHTTLEHSNVSIAKNQIGGLQFERALPGDKRLSRLASVARSRNFREQQGKILLEGRRLICDALDAGANPQMVFFSKTDRLIELPVEKLKRATLVKVKFEDIKMWSDLVAPQGVIAIFSRPDPTRLRFPETGHSVPLTLICDNIRDPGNLGTILRCAAAAGCHSVLLTKGCVDAWEPKVLRAAMGAHFRLPIYPCLSWNDIESLLPKVVTVHVADNCSSSERATLAAEPQSNMSAKHGDYGWVSGRTHHEEYQSDSDSDSDVELQLPRVDAKQYHERWAHIPTALVIGGETHGLSLEAVQLAERTSGERLLIPVVACVDSLNSAMAASILLFEGRRQLLHLMEASGSKPKPKER